MNMPYNSGYHVGEGSWPIYVTNNFRYCIDGYDGKEYYPVCKKCLTGDCNGNLSKVPLFVTDVAAIANYTVDLTISYSDGSSVTTTLSKNTKYVIKYVHEGMIVQAVGVITGIGKINNSSNCTCDCCNGEDYLIRIDCSNEYNSNVITIRSSMIRDIKPYTKYADEDSTIKSSIVRGATVFGTIENIKIEDATVSPTGVVIKGTIVKGNITDNCAIADGCAVGDNKYGHHIVVINATTEGGNIINGNIMSAKVYDYTITDGELNPETGYTTGCIIEAAKGMVVANDGTVVGGISSNGTVIDPVIKNSVVAGGVRTGVDVVTTKAIVVGGIGYGGASEGGVLTGGTATGEINGKMYTIEDGITTGGFSNKCTVTGGVIHGGTTIGDTTIGSIIEGGVVDCGVTFEGTTTLGEDGVIKTGSFRLPEGLIDTICAKAGEDVAAFEKDINNLVIWFTSDVGGFHFDTNIGKTKI